MIGRLLIVVLCSIALASPGSACINDCRTDDDCDYPCESCSTQGFCE